MELLKNLCQIFAPAGDEGLMKKFMLDYIQQNKQHWKVEPQIFADDRLFQDNIVLVFGKPRTIIFAHMDSIGFMVRYNNEVVRLGGPVTENGFRLKGKDSQGEISCTLKVEEIEEPAKNGGEPTKKKIFKADFERTIDVGTYLVFECDFREDENYVQSCYLDDRLGCWVALKTAETLENGIIVFSTWEETGGGAVPYLIRFIYENYAVNQALIADISWITEGVKAGEGVVISMRDSLIPRRKFINKIIEIAQEHKIPYQLEVEASGGSDAKELQFSPYPMNWAFVGAAEDFVHTPNEKVHKKDIDAMLDIYRVLMQVL